MPIESGTTLSSLDALWPLSGDFILEGDDHLRLLKQVLKAQFPGAIGQGYNTPILANEEELNWLQGLQSNVQDQIDALILDYQSNLNAPTGTVMVFHQAAPPAGWTQVNSNNDSMLRVVNTAGGAGGSDSPISIAFAHTHTTGNVALTVDQMPAHQHDSPKNQGGSTGGENNAPFGSGGASPGRIHDGHPSGSLGKNYSLTSSLGGGAIHNHGSTASAGTTFLPRYINVMTAVKS